MGIIPDIYLIVVPPILGLILSLTKPSRTWKAIIWILVIIIPVCGIYSHFSTEIHKKEEIKQRKLLEIKIDDIKINIDDFLNEVIKEKLATYPNNLDENDSLKELLREGRNYESQSKFKDAITEYDKCLSHPKVTLGNRIALHITIGNCHFSLTELADAQRCYTIALSDSDKLDDDKEIIQIKSVIYSNLGLVYQQLGMLDQAIESHEKAFHFYKSIGDLSWGTKQLNDLSALYQTLGKPQEALKYSQMAMENIELYHINEINNNE